MSNQTHQYPSAEYHMQHLPQGVPSLPAVAPAVPLIAAPGVANIAGNVAMPGYTYGTVAQNNYLSTESNTGHGLSNFNPMATHATDTAYKTFFLEFLNIQETPSYLDQYNRHYVPNVKTEHVVSDLVQDMLRCGGVPGAHTMATHAANFYSLNMASNDSDKIYIPEGFRSKRAKFLMLVREVDKQFNKTYMTYLNGFTDHFGVSALMGRTTIDDDMVFYINSIVTLVEENYKDPLTGAVSSCWNVFQASQIVDGQLVSVDVPTMQSTNAHFLRPADLISNLSAVSTQETGMSRWFTIDGQTSSAGGLTSQFNNTGNNLPTTFLSRLVQPVLNSGSGLGERPGLGGMASSMSALSLNNEFGLDNCSFLRYMSRQTGVPLTSRFTPAQLAKLDPTIGQRIKHIPVIQSNYANINAQSLDSTPWNYQSIETEIATKIVSSVPSLLWENFSAQASFSLTNKTPGRQVLLSWSFLQFITPTGLPSFQQRLESQLQTAVMMDITRGNHIPLQVDVFSDVNGETVVKVDVSGTKYSYTSPSFACGIINPVHTNNTTLHNNIVAGFGQLVESITMARHSEGGFDTNNKILF